jgi:hypothetical protein
MTSIDKVIENPLLRDIHAQNKSELMISFPELSSCSHGYFLSLWKYLSEIPHQFYSVPVHLEYSEWLEERDRTDRLQLQSYFLEHAAEIDRAFLHLEEINGLDWHDSFKKLDDYEVIRFIDQQVHPTYLRLVEAVFCPFLHLIAHFSRIDRGKGIEGLDLWSIVQELQGFCLDDAICSYHHIIRNGIGHGGVIYFENSICYRDKKGCEKKYYDSEVIRICDDLLDACNAFALGISIFLLVRQSDGYELPKQLLIEELKAETRSPWWEIIGCTPSYFSDRKQLIIYARPQTVDFSKVQWTTFQSGVLAERFAPGFDRYFFSLRSKMSYPGWAAFDGKKLRMLREEQKFSMEDYRNVIEDNLVFYVPRFRLPRVLSRFESLFFAFSINLPLVIANICNQLDKAEVDVRNIEIHRNSWGCVVNGDVFIKKQSGKIDQDFIRKSCRSIIQKALSHGRRETSLLNVTRYVPIGFARVAVFQKNHRKRRLAGYGLEKDLVCTVQVQRISRIRAPDIMGSVIETYGKYRIAWNEEWLKNIK